MFMLYALVVGIVVGRLLGGRLERIAALRFRWVPLALAGLAVQVALFSSPLTEHVGPLGPPLYVASTIAVLVVVGRNITIPGLALVALGAVSNLAAIVANGGFMPASPSALEALGRTAGTGFSNSVVLGDPALAPLTDVFAMPSFLPFANVFSVGDVLIGLGVSLALVSAMRRPVRPDNSPDLLGGTSTSGLFRTRR